LTDIEEKNASTEMKNTAPASLLDSCKPTASLLPAGSPPTASIIRKSGRAEVFTTTGMPPIIAVIIDRKLDSWGNSSGEIFHPVTGEIQNQVAAGIRSLAFHPCVSASGQAFIYPQKLDPAHSWANSWNASLATALTLPPGQWRTVWSDKGAECYQHDLVTAPVEGIPEYPHFQADLENALSPNIIDSLEHPVIQQLLGNQSAVNDLEVY
jgi:hypothetical protein